MRRMSAGHGYRYLLNSVAQADAGRAGPMAYYSSPGTPPGRWVGSGVAALAGGELAVGDRVSEEQLGLLFGQGRDPVSGEALGRAYPQSAADTARTAVAGYDLTFSVPKSVSVLWALAPAEVRHQIRQVHHAAIADVLGLFEAQVAATRVGSSGADAAVAQVDVGGVAGVAFDHWDSRSGDPQLHTHVVISNKVRTSSDGLWRALDGRPVHAAMVALSEHYNAVLADRLTATLGLTWEQRSRGVDRNAALELACIPQPLIDRFSSRTHAIEQEVDRLIADYTSNHGPRPSPRTIIKLRQQATLATRDAKTVQSLSDLVASWTTTAMGLLGEDATRWAARQLHEAPAPASAGVGAVEVEQVATAVLETVGERRSTWHRWNLHAEASRQLATIRFATPEQRLQTVEAIVAAAAHASVPLTPPEITPAPAELQRGDGTSVFRPAHATRYTSHALLDAEDTLRTLAAATDGPNADAHVTATVVQLPDESGQELGEDQAAAVSAIARSGRRVDLLVGPAGAGKTTTLAGLRRVWETSHGPNSVVGLAPSAAAAEVLGDELGIATENTAKWLHDHTAGRGGLRRGQLVIIDEASMAGTHTLHRIAAHAAEVGAKVLLVGDPHQLGAVQAGGAFSLLASDRPHAPQLRDVRRFSNQWEADNSLLLRQGDPAAICVLQRHARVREGNTDDVLDRAYTAWRTDRQAGLHSVLIAPTNTIAADLNQRARTDRIATGAVAATGEVELGDGTRASTGDHIITRHNDRRLTAGQRWVRNGDHWTVTTTHPDGSITATRPRGGPSVRLPADYVAAHVQLGYSVTVHRAQGATVDTAHAILTASQDREHAYVALTRGRHANTAWIATDHPDAEPHATGEPPAGADVLRSVVARSGVEQSATAIIRAEQDKATSLRQLVAEYETIAQAAQHRRWASLIEQTLPDTEATRVLTAPAWGALQTALRRADAHGHDIDQLLPRLSSDVDRADDPAAVLHHRLTQAASRRRPAYQPRLIAGLLPTATGTMQPDMRAALAARAELIEQHGATLADAAIQAREPWVQHLGPPPADPAAREHWNADLRTVALHRALNDITDPTDHGVSAPSPTTAAARTAIASARRLNPTPSQRRTPQSPTRSLGM